MVSKLTINLTAALLLLVLAASLVQAAKSASNNRTTTTKSGVDEKPKVVFKIPKQELKKQEQATEIVYKELDSANRSLANFGRTKRQAQSKSIYIIFLLLLLNAYISGVYLLIII